MKWGQMIWLIRLLCFMTAVSLTPLCYASDISLNLSVASENNVVNISVSNSGRDPAANLRIKLELDGASYAVEVQPTLLPGGFASAQARVAYPHTVGTYPLYTTISYDNNGQTLSLVNVGYFHFREPVPLKLSCPELAVRMQRNTVLQNPLTHPARLFLPEEIAQAEEIPGARWSLLNTRPEFGLTTPFFLVAEIQDGPLHSTGICRGTLSARRLLGYNSLFPTWFITLCGAVSLVVSRIAFGRAVRTAFSERTICFARATYSIFLISGAIVLSRVAGVVPDALLGKVDLLRHTIGPGLTAALQSQLEWLYFQGGDYDYFFRYICDPLYLYFLCLNYWVLRYLIRPDPERDKTWHLMKSCFSLGSKEGLYWSPLSKVGLLAFLVKLFYVPLMSSWTVNNFIHQYELWHSLSWDFVHINDFVVALLILVDVLIFAVGYMLELPQLNNTIRSVEPTLFGWVICLICYPPFNQVFTQLVDRPLGRYVKLYIPGFETAALVGVTLLWAIYVWATVALGLRSSNLTNRGIVSRGPYAFFRHPAYVSKVALWGVTAIFLGTLNVCLVPLFASIYALRAWTEERHLGQDPEYQEYRKRVPWKLIPRVW
ncbi:MAG: isoprenylcysteine carboxylmethyltransferase family protein [Bdellovibrionota bacterium]